MSITMKLYLLSSLAWGLFSLGFALSEPKKTRGENESFEVSEVCWLADSLTNAYRREHQKTIERLESIAEIWDQNALIASKLAISKKTIKAKFRAAEKREPGYMIFTPSATNPFSRPKLEELAPLDPSRGRRVVLTSKGN